LVLLYKPVRLPATEATSYDNKRQTQTPKLGNGRGEGREMRDFDFAVYKAEH